MMEITNTLHSGMCRCCSSEGTFKDIKTKYHWMGEEEVYADMLTDCFDVKLCTPDDMENGICEVCITQLRNAVNFKKQVLHTEEQFKRRLQNKDVKNPIKLESVDEDPIESDHDHLSDADFSGTEYEVPIKEELEEKPKTKKRAAKATTSRAKKAKAEPESSKKQIGEGCQKVFKTETGLDVEILQKLSNTERKDQENVIKGLIRKAPDMKSHEKILRVVLQKYEPAKKVVTTKTGVNLAIQLKHSANRERRDQNDVIKKSRKKQPPDMKLHDENLRIVLRCSTATPIRSRCSLGYRCYYCDNEYADPADLRKHCTEDHSHDDKPVKSCQSPYFHMKMDITGLRCKLCNNPFDQLETLMEHLKEIHGERAHTDLKKNHLIPFKFDTEQLKCAICDLEFYNFHMLLDHMRKHYRNYICDICDEGYLNFNSLRCHRLGHKKGEFPCKECDKVFTTRPNLQAHIRSVHLGIRRNKCGYCGEKFTELSWKLDHLEKVHGIKKPDYICKICEKKFTCLKTLDNHIRGVHLMEKGEQCSECGMKFFKKTALRQHMVVHTGHRAFQCPICSKWFQRRCTLKEHKRIHMDDRRFKCQYCSMAFIQKCSLKGHLRSKHGEDI